MSSRFSFWKRSTGPKPGRRHAERARCVPGLETMEDRVVLSGVTAMQGNQCTFDLVFVLDGSGSISPEDFLLEQQFVTTMLTEFVISPQFAQFGVIQFSSPGTAEIITPITDDQGAIIAAVTGMVQINGSTDIAEGLTFAVNEFAASGRAGVPQVIVLVTDGVNNGPTNPVTVADAFKNSGGLIFSVGVGDGIDQAQLEAIASKPSSTFVSLVDSFDDLENIIEGMAMQICQVTTAGPIVTNLQRFGYHIQTTTLVATFDQDLNPTPAQNVNNYTLIWAGHDRRFGTHDDRKVPIVTAVYNNAARTVTLTTANRLPLRGLYGLVINGKAPNGLTSASGTFLDGRGNGSPGTDYVKFFGREIAVIPRHHPFPLAHAALRPHRIEFNPRTQRLRVVR